MLGRAVHPHTATDGEPLDTTPELTSGINSDGTVLEPTTATSPSSRPGESGSVRHQKQTRQSPPEEWTSCYPKRTCHAPPITIGILVGDVKAPVVGVPLCKKEDRVTMLYFCIGVYVSFMNVQENVYRPDSSLLYQSCLYLYLL